MPKKTMTDRQILEILYLRDVREMTVTQVARYMKVSRNTVLGMYHRCKIAPSIGDGTMPDRWWEEGLRRQEAFAKIKIDL